MEYAIGIDLGGSSVKSVVVDPEGNLLGQGQRSFDVERPRHWAEVIREWVGEEQAKQGRAPRAVGVSAPGLAAPDGRCIAHMPGRLQGLEGFEWGPFLGLGYPVPVLNDAQAALLGEVWLGAARGVANAILLTLGTGVGGAALVDGRLLRGHTGRAGHLGHVSLDIDGPPDVCRMPGSLEVLMGNCTIHERTQGRFATTHELVAAHQKGDPEATMIWLRSVRALACAIASFGNVLDPEVVVVGGGIARAGEALFRPLREMVAEFEWSSIGYRLQVVPAVLGELAGAYGSACHGLRSRVEPGDA